MTGAVVVFRDITERREVDRLKDEFTSVISHELRTPLTSLRGSLGLVAGGITGPLPDKARRMIDIAVNNADRLVRLINDILDIERIEAGRISMEKHDCELGALFDQAAEEMGAMGAQAGVRLSGEPAGARVWADPDRIVQTLTNLVSNAIKFSPSGATVTLGAESRDGKMVVRVSDTGRGIPPDKLESIFERFQQVDSSDSREKGGTGLGLPICRSIVEQHGGRIWAESTLGEGSTFSFTLPMSVARTITNRGPDGPAVLVCDDDPIVSELVGALLEQRGFRASYASSGAEAIEIAARERPAVILLDLLMPGMSGWETAAALSQRAETRHIPIVILSVVASQEAQRPAAVVDWVDKPVDEASLFRALDHALARRGGVSRVVIVEDDVDLVEVLSAMFESRGIEAFHAGTGQAAVELVRRIEPDLLVLDLNLPDGDGFEVAGELRSHDRLRALPLVVYTARELSGAERERLRLGQTEFLVKGRTTPEDFEQRVLELLERITTAPVEEEMALGGSRG